MNPAKLPSVDLKQLAYFGAVADHGSISAAAAALDLAQPSLSEHISRLEKRLEVQLLIRGGHGVQLTEAGVALAKYAREILRSVDSAVDDVRHLGGEARGPVSVGFPPSLGLLLSVPLAETVQIEFPHIRLHIAEAMSGHILDWIHSARLDLGCVYYVNESAPLSIRPILAERLFLVTARDNWQGEIGADGRALAPISLADLRHLPLVLPSRPHGAREIIEQITKANGVRLNVVTEIDSLPQIISMVDRASAYTILPHAAVLNQVAAGKLAIVSIEQPSIRRTAYLIRSRVRAVTRASIAIENSMSTIIREMIERYHLDATLPTDSITPR
ncbi:MAG: LysR family transcriptional regulator [Pseudomonadota bacterium]|nr:LysR family transcriptional regulator [Pseudomonadota bacterium]